MSALVFRGSSSRSGQTYRPRRQRHRGVVMIYVALIGMVLLMLLGLACDSAYVYWTSTQLQNAADAAALAGAERLVDDSTGTVALTNAQNTALDNRAGGAAVQVTTQPSSSADVQVGTYDFGTGAFTTGGSVNNAIKVTARRNSGSLAGPLKLLFSPGFPGAPGTANVVRTAIAVSDTGPAAGLLVLDPSASGAISMNGNTSIDITNGGVVVDSSSSTAVSATSGSITATGLYITGNDTGASGDSTGTFKVNQAVTPDPLASLSPPAKPAVPPSPNPNAQGIYQPGYYPSGLPVGTLASGIYWVDGGIDFNNGTLDATAGCLIYLHTGSIDNHGLGDMKLAPLTSGPYAGICIYQDRADTAGVTLGGGANSTCTGRLYFPSADVTLAGTPGSLGTQFICNTLTLKGNATLNVNFAPLAPTNHIAFLVQ